MVGQFHHVNPPLGAVHLLGDGRVARFGQAIHACADQEVGLGLLGGIEQLVDVALAITDESFPGRLQCFQESLIVRCSLGRFGHDPSGNPFV